MKSQENRDDRPNVAYVRNMIARRPTPDDGDWRGWLRWGMKMLLDLGLCPAGEFVDCFAEAQRISSDCRLFCVHCSGDAECSRSESLAESSEQIWEIVSKECTPERCMAGARRSQLTTMLSEHFIGNAYPLDSERHHI